MRLTVTMVLPDGEGRWYIEGREDTLSAKAPEDTTVTVALHLQLTPDQRVPEIGDVLDLPQKETS